MPVKMEPPDNKISLAVLPVASDFSETAIELSMPRRAVRRDCSAAGLLERFERLPFQIVRELHLSDTRSFSRIAQDLLAVSGLASESHITPDVLDTIEVLRKDVLAVKEHGNLKGLRAHETQLRAEK